jgi:hypothetical protein
VIWPSGHLYVSHAPNGQLVRKETKRTEVSGEGEEGRRAFWRKQSPVGPRAGAVFLEGLAVVPLSRRPFFFNVVVALVVSCFAADSKEGQPLPARDVYCSASD